MTNFTDIFIDTLYNCSKSEFAEKIKHQAKRCLLDYIGVTLTGAQLLEDKKKNLSIALGKAEGNITLIGFGDKTSVERAAFINGLCAHVAELDDGVISGIVHPGSPIISALLPLAEKENVKGDDLLKGIIVGYEAAVRLACSIQPSHKKKGYHATATCGAIGSAIGIATMMHFSKLEMKIALSVAAVSAFGTLKVLENNSELKPYNVAQAALIGIFSAAMAKAQFNVPDDVLSGDTGFLKMVTDSFDPSHLYEYQKVYAIEQVYFKPYAACRYCHSAIDAALKVKQKYSINIEDIKKINIATYSLAVNNHDHIQIDCPSSAKMSIPYSVAVSIVTNEAGIKQFTQKYIDNIEIISLTKKISVRADEEISSLFPKQSAALIEIYTNDGEIYTEKVDKPKGDPENPLTDIELLQKFEQSAEFRNKSEEERGKIINIVRNIEKDLPKLYQYL